MFSCQNGPLKFKNCYWPKTNAYRKNSERACGASPGGSQSFPGSPTQLATWENSGICPETLRKLSPSFFDKAIRMSKISIFGVLSSGSHSFNNAFQKNLRRVLESWKPCDFKTVLTFYIWLSEVWEKYDLLSVLFGSIVSNYSRIHWQKLISWKFDENFCIFCKIESIYVQINSLEIIKSAVLSRFRFTVFCYTKLVKFCHHVLDVKIYISNRDHTDDKDDLIQS